MKAKDLTRLDDAVTKHQKVLSKVRALDFGVAAIDVSTQLYEFAEGLNQGNGHKEYIKVVPPSILRHHKLRWAICTGMSDTYKGGSWSFNCAPHKKTMLALAIFCRHE